MGPLTTDQRDEIKDVGIESRRSRHSKQSAARDFHDANKRRHQMQAGIPLHEASANCASWLTFFIKRMQIAREYQLQITLSDAAGQTKTYPRFDVAGLAGAATTAYI